MTVGFPFCSAVSRGIEARSRFSNVGAPDARLRATNAAMPNPTAPPAMRGFEIPLLLLGRGELVSWPDALQRAGLTRMGAAAAFRRWWNSLLVGLAKETLPEAQTQLIFKLSNSCMVRRPFASDKETCKVEDEAALRELTAAWILQRICIRLVSGQATLLSPTTLSLSLQIQL